MKSQFRVVAAFLPCLLTVAPSASAEDDPAKMAPYVAVMVAGDDELPVFDNATVAVEALLRRTGAASTVARLSAAPRDEVRAATLERVLAAIGAMRPAAGQACLVFATSHGVPGQGVYLSSDDEVLTPAALDQALATGCGQAPTVVIVSSCFSGLFSRAPMVRPNRVILTAARADRTSFGCGAGRTYTVYDHCLLDSLGHDRTWPAVFKSVRACVTAEERREKVLASLPQAWFGAGASDLRVPGNTPLIVR